MLERIAGKALLRFLSKYFILPGDVQKEDNSDDASIPSDVEPTTNGSERQRVQSTLLSKTQVAVWSGFVSLENLQLRHSLANDLFQKKGLPFELISGTIKAAEITVPWRQLRSFLSGNSSALNGDAKSKGETTGSDETDVIIVLDGISLLFTTKYEFYDEKLKESGKLSRRKELEEAMAFMTDPSSSSPASSSSRSFQSYLKQRLLSENLLNELFDNLTNRIQIHLRNLHIRLEDLESDPTHPWSTGITLESLHITSELDLDIAESFETRPFPDRPNNSNNEDAKIRRVLAQKVIQINHFSIYCNAIDVFYDDSPDPKIRRGSDITDSSEVGDGCNGNHASSSPSSPPPPPELLPIQCLYDQPDLLSRAMLSGIPRRHPRSLQQNKSNGHCPLHTFLLRPLEATCKALLSKPSSDTDSNCDTTRAKAKLEATTQIPSLHIGLTPSTLVQILSFHARVKHHLSLKRHRIHRPQKDKTPITHPRLWWKYAAKCILRELREGGSGAYKSNRKVRWNWGRWHERVHLRKIYGELYQRWMEYGVSESCENFSRTASTGLNGNHHINGATSPSAARSNGNHHSNASMNVMDNNGISLSAKSPNQSTHNTTQEVSNSLFERPLSLEEFKEMNAIEDGSVGDLSVRDILLFRAVVRAKLKKSSPENARSKSSGQNAISSKTSSPLSKSRHRLTDYLRGVLKTERLDGQEECIRLVQYLEKKEEEDAEKEQQLQQQQLNQGTNFSGSTHSRNMLSVVPFETMIVVSVQTHVEKGSISLSTMLPNTSYSVSLKAPPQQQHFCFFDISFDKLGSKYSILENFESIILEASIHDYRGKEFRSDGSCNVVFSRSNSASTVTGFENLMLPLNLAKGNNASSLKPLRRQDRSFKRTPTKLDCIAPIFHMNFMWNPPGDSVDASIILFQEKILFYVNPGCEWPRRFRDMFSISDLLRAAKPPDVNSFWEDLQMAYINSWKSTKASLTAKAEQALLKQRKFDADIRFDLPSLTILDDNGTSVTIDMGTAILVTEHLAGVPKDDDTNLCGKPSGYIPKLTKESSQVDGPITGIAAESPSTPTRGTSSCHLLFSPGTTLCSESPHTGGVDCVSIGESASALSMDSGRRRRGRSFGLHEVKLFSVAENETIVGEDTELQNADQHELIQCFYDSYRVSVGVINISISQGNSESFSLFTGSGLDFFLKKSIIPSDQNLPRLRLSSQVNAISIHLSRDSLIRLGLLIKKLRSDFETKSPHCHNRQPSQKFGQFETAQSPGEIESTDSTSIIDENEFLDAIDEYEPDNADDWFEQKWIPDIESKSFGDITMNTFSRNERRLRFPSISEVSSKSDRRESYLSAENLAKLEDLPIGTNDTGFGASQVSCGDEDSFYSVISLDDEKKLKNAIASDILKAEEEVDLVKEKIKRTAESYIEKWQNDGETMSKQEIYKQRNTKKALKLELLRAEAELNALKACYRELAAQVALDNLPERVKLDLSQSPIDSAIDQGKNSAGAESVMKSLYHETFSRAKSLMKAREKRASVARTISPTKKLPDQHNLIESLNKDLVFSSMIVSSVTVKFCEDEIVAKDLTTDYGAIAILELSDARLVAHIRRYDRSVFSSIGKICAWSNVSGHFFLGGLPCDETHQTLCSQYPHLFPVDTQDEQFCRIQWKCIKSRKNSKNTIQLSFGPIEGTPSNSLADLVTLVKPTRQAEENPADIAADDPITKIACVLMGTGPIKSDSSLNPKVHYSIDLNCRFSSFCVRVGDDAQDKVGAIVISGLRFGISRRSGPLNYRGQLDAKISNIQILNGTEKVCELFGQRSIYDDMFVGRIRIQLAPKSECGGWVVESTDYKPVEHDDDDSIWDLHVGAKIHSPATVVSPDLIEVMNCIKITANAFRTEETHDATRFDKGHHLRSNRSLPIRWRIDTSMIDAFIILPGKDCNFSGVNDVIGNNICLAWTTEALICQDYCHGTIVVSGVVRPSIDAITPRISANVLIPCTLNIDALLSPDLLKVERILDASLPGLSPPSRWTSPDLSSKLDENDLPIQDGIHIELSLTASPITFNLSSLLLRLANETRNHIKKVSFSASTSDSVHTQNSPRNTLASLKINLPSLDIKIVDMELNRTPSIPFVLLSVNTTYVEFMPGDDQTSVLFSIKDIKLFEVKNGVGIPVFYTSPIISEGADNSYDDESYFHASITKITKKLLPSSVDLSSRIGKSFVLMLPEVVQKMVDFFNATKFKDKQARDTDVGVTNDRTIGLPFDASLIRFKACFNGINIMLPSQNVYNVMDNCEENQTDILHVVCIDWNLVFNGTLVSCNEKRNGFTPVTAIIQTEEKNILDTWDELVKRIGGDEGITQSNDNCDGNSLLASKIDWKSLDFQIMRTCVLLHRSKAMDRLPFKSTFSLEKTTGLFSDQKIIYPFQLSLVLSCVVFSEGNAHDHDNKLSSSYGIQFDVSFVELIWHLARSRHGLSDAYEVSISPILDILKRSEGRVNRNDMASPEMMTLQSVMQTSSPIEHSQTSFDDQKRTTIKIPKSVYMHFQQAMMVISARLDGVQVTCVPSNATAVNLIPIVKVQLSSARFGSMVMACPSDGGVDIISKSRESTSDDCYQTASLYFSAWSESEISAHYHNLRLLMWEPLIETWGANTRSIANLSEILQVDPYPVGTKNVSSPKSSNAVDFTRLIRFILARGNQLDKTGIVEANAEPVSAEVNGLDVCYVLQCLISPGCTWLAKCPSINNVTFSFPSENESVHLLQHGCPTHSGSDKISAMLRFNYLNDRSASAFNTQQTLNINITGAFFDTLAFSELGSKPSTRKIAAHSIRNESGLFMRWSGELDEIGELPTGREAPLSLKRGFPHRAFICLEFWDKEPKVNESPTSFKATGRVPVDLIGLNKYALRTIDGEHQPTIWIIVRVLMSGSAKVVSIESPAFVSNVTSHSLNIRMYNKATEVFQVTLPPKPPEDTSAVGCTAPIPATLVPFVNSSSWKLSVPCGGGRKVFESDGDVSFPKPFSKTVTSKGLISSKQVSFSGASLDDCFSINACAIRIGNETIPEQRLLAFRNTIVVRNNLPHSIFLQVRVKIDASKPFDEWIDMGRIVSGHIIPFSRARCSDDVECRIKVLIPDEDSWSMRPAEIFPYWSSSLFIPPEDSLDHTNHFNIVINDHNNVPLQLRALVETDTPKHHGAQSRSNDVRSYQIGLGQRVVSIYSPFIIADHTGQNIEFKSNKSIVAGQREPLGKARLIASVPQLNQITSDGKQNTSWPGLSNVRKHQRWRSPMDTSAEIFMLGGENTTNLTVRQSAKPDSQWSRPISISSKRAVDRIIVPRLHHPLPPLILCSRMHSAPEQLGGIKTTIISLFNKFCLVNLLDVEIEIISTNKRGFGQNRKPLTIGVNKAPIPWHFDDSGYCRLRPKELGWSFSGLVSMRKKRRDVSLRVRNKLTGKAIIVTIEFNRLNKTPNVLVVIRASRSIPFRLENLTTTPLQFTQPSFFGGFRSRGLEEPTILLPYHKAFYSWDFPDLCKRFILLEKADFEFEGHPSEDRVLARLFLDYLAPGTELKIENANITVSIVTDGSTRVLRVIDATISTDALGNSMVPKKCDDQLKCLFDIQLNVGASLIDWGPRELVYFRLSEVRVHILRLSDAEFVNVSIGQVSADCQLWLTPYPILLSIGNREEHKKDAFSASWCLDLVTRSNRFYQLLRNVEVKVDTLKLKIDGHLASLIAEMFYISSGLLGRRKKPKSTIDFDYDFNQKLTYAEDTAVAASKMNHYSFDDNNQMTITSNASESNRSVYSFISDEQRGVTTKVKQKYYIEKIRISSIKAEISWCGSLPLTFLLPRWLSPALMFDALPIMFPAYSNSHVYGSVEDHLENIKSHYNIWRFLFGLSFKPTFVLKSCIFTSMQSIASFLNNISGASALALDNLSGQHRATRNTGEKSFGLVDAPSCFFSPIASFVLRKLLRASMWASSLFDFAKVPGNDSSAVRIRAPRLFANHDQNDLLVEYVEGENAGEALLSRVRSGRHLYEGYVGHGIIDGMDGDSPPSFASQLCFILTFERLLVVTNGENVNVCDVAWEVLLDDITMVHLSEATDLGGRSFFQVWYLENPEESIQASSPWLMPGLDSLSRRKIYFRESHSGRQLLNKASTVARFCMSVEQ